MRNLQEKYGTCSVRNGVAEQNVAVAVYGASTEAMAAIQQLRQSGFDMKKVSVAGRYDLGEGAVVGFHYAGDRMRYAGKLDEFWGLLWGVLFGPVLALGPLGAWIAAVLNNVPVFGGLSVFGAGLYSVGIPKDNVLRYEAWVKAGSLLVIAHGTSEETGKAREILHSGLQGGRYSPA